MAAKLDSANEAVIAALESCTQEQLGKKCEGEGWTPTVAAHHVATSHEGICGLAMLHRQRPAASGRSPCTWR